MNTKSQASNGIAILISDVVQHFLQDKKTREVEQQRAVYDGEKNITNVLAPAQEKAKYEGQIFKPDLERAEEYAKSSLEFGVSSRLVSSRLESAFACYKAGMQLECLRHILSALDVICCALEWDKASAYLNKQNRILCHMKKKEEEAA